MQEEHFSLYLDLEDGRKADLEVVARASLSLSMLFKELSYIIDPSIEIKLELESGTEGSLSLNTIIRTVKEYAKPGNTTLIGVIISVIMMLFHEGKTFAVQKAFEDFFKSEQVVKLSDEDIEKLANKMADAANNKVAKEHAEQFYREIERDTSVKGVGATQAPGARPTNIVPREQFKAKSGAIEIVEESSEKRSKTALQAVTLVSPVLIEGKRQWKFKFNDIEFGAKIADKKFLSDVLHGKLRIAMKSGIQLFVEMRTDEEKIDDVWTVRARTILRVIKIPKQALQTTLDFSESKDEEK